MGLVRRESPAVTCIWPLACSLGEGPLWWQDAVWFTDIKENSIHRFDPASGQKLSWRTPSEVGFLAPLKNGRFIAGAKTGLYDFDPVNGDFALIRTVEPALPNNRLNDAAVDSRGRLWFGSMDDHEREPSGMLYRFDRGSLTAMDSGYVITNGPAFSPDGTRLYHTDTLERRIYAFDLREDGSLANKRVFITIEEGAGYPDGSVVDGEGCLWIGLFGGWQARRYAADGRLLERVAFPVANVTKLAFGGPGLTTLYATTARKGLNQDALLSQPLAGGLFCFEAKVPGLPQFPTSLESG
ncbi:MAG TPA: SMP-30/gluconolactonase/LRE family protein [Rhizomicrobium sp.]|nr:SMP-30/gluconolactonase/LRE family protein [Rhizomicrobium sp.]